MTVFKSRTFCYAKDGENPDQNQDAFQVDASRGIAVVADGVSSAIFSAAWAKILTQHIVADLPDPGDGAAFSTWLNGLRKEWEAGIETDNLAWFQRPKLASGAFSTLLWTHVREIVPPKPGTPGWEKMRDPDPSRRCFHVKGACIGDSCLFHIRPGSTNSGMFPGTDLFCALPLTDPAAFDLPPIVIGSKDLGRDAQMKFTPIELLVQEGDLLILATDAVSQWLLRCYEAQAYPRWDLFWELDQASWETELDAMRANGEIRYDDSTLVLLQMGNSEIFLNRCDETGLRSVDDLSSADPVSADLSVAALYAAETETAANAEMNPEEEDEEIEIEIELESETHPESEREPENRTRDGVSFTPAADLAAEHGENLNEEAPVFAAKETEISAEDSAFMTEDHTEDGAFDFAEDGEAFDFADGGEADEAESMRTWENAKTSAGCSSIGVSGDTARQGISRSADTAGAVGAGKTQGGFRYRMASSKTPRRFEDGGELAAGSAGNSGVLGTGNAAGRLSGRHSGGPPAGRQSAVSGRSAMGTPEKTEESADLSEGWQQIRDGSVQIAGILGDQLSEGMSRLGSSMNRLGSQLNEGVGQFSDAAKPKLQNMASRFVGLFRRKESDGSEAASGDTQEPESEVPPKRVIDPNRRRFYNPPPRE